MAERPRLQVLGTGSPAGDDRVGWAVVDALGRRLPADAEVRLLTLDRPGVALLDALRQAEHSLLVDALWLPERAGEILRLQPHELRAEACLSAHGVGVAEVLALAEALGERLSLEVWAVAVGEVAPWREVLSAPVAAAVQPLVERLAARIEQITRPAHA